MSVEEIGNAFVNHFYSTLDSNPMGLASLYQPGSTLTAQGQTFVGVENIIGKYMNPRSQHNVPQLTRDFQVTASSALIIFVTGELVIEGQTNPLLFSQCFELISTGPNQYYIHNDIFRLISA